ncbi:MAG: hypothetical protein WC783_02695 [Candidatus Paceibacterota bacterium]|jgi:hypothetical protein
MITREDIFEWISWQDNYKDLYPGYSPDESNFTDEYYFDTREGAVLFANQVISVFETLASDPTIKIYRAISAKSKLDINLEYLGDAWSFEMDSAVEFGSHNGSNFLITAETTPSNIDWEQSIKNYLEFSGNYEADDENELVIIDSSIINLKSIRPI